MELKISEVDTTTFNILIISKNHILVTSDPTYVTKTLVSLKKTFHTRKKKVLRRNKIFMYFSYDNNYSQIFDCLRDHQNNPQLLIHL